MSVEDLEELSLNVLVTGATGFIGSRLVERLYSEKYNVIILKRSTSNSWRIKHLLKYIENYDVDKIKLKEVFKNSKIDVIVHLAANQGRQGEAIKEVIDSNITFPAVLIETALNQDDKLKVFINTDTILEDYYSYYAATKKAFLSVLSCFNKMKDLNVINLKLEYVYGPGDDDSKFLPYMIKSILAGKHIDASPGMQRRDFIFIDDVVDAYTRCIRSFDKLKDRYISIDIGSGDSVSMKDVALMVERLTSCKANIRWGAVDYRKNEIFTSKADINKAAELINWKPEYTLEDGLKNTIDCYMKEVRQ